MRETVKMGRPREFDSDEALEEIMTCFWRAGYEGTSMSDLERATGLKKGSLYAAFGDKRSMYRKALAHYNKTFIERAVDALKGAGTPRSRLARFLEAAIQKDPGPTSALGCFVCNAAMDQAPADPDAAKLVQQSLKRLELALQTVISEFHAGDVRAKAEVARQAHHLLTTYFGLRVLARAGSDATLLRSAKEATLASLKRS